MKSCNRHRLGTSLLEVMAATMLVSLTMIPMTASLIQCSKWANRMEYQSELQTLAESCIERTKYELTKPGEFTPGPKGAGNLSPLGMPRVFYSTTCNRSNLGADADIANNYLEISVRVWADLDGNGTFTPGAEPEYSVTTGFAKP